MGSAVRTATPVISSARSATAVTPSDSTVVTCAGIYVGGTGDITVTLQSTLSAVTFKAVPQGVILPVAISNGFINATGTTATNLVALDW